MILLAITSSQLMLFLVCMLAITAVAIAIIRP